MQPFCQRRLIPLPSDAPTQRALRLELSERRSGREGVWVLEASPVVGKDPSRPGTCSLVKMIAIPADVGTALVENLLKWNDMDPSQRAR